MADPKKATSVRGCTCVHEYQDKKYGPGMRVHNLAAKDNGWVCTVCGAKKGA
jgi:hypothetical protein